ncbi:MAG: trypsin-like peptidase domain-containing protein [Rhodobacteraceae bacterium]|nr:trypsin-like peptidase domain-containing protein [Paracoccaceae bacterium]
MTRVFRTAAFVILACVLSLAVPARAQDAFWVQVEAHMSTAETIERAESYQFSVGGASGFRLPSGWNAVVLGPYETREDADAVRRQLLSERLIPNDAFVADGRGFGTRLYPAGDTAAEAPAAPAPEAPAPEAPAPEAPAPETQATQTPEPQTPAPEAATASVSADPEPEAPGEPAEPPEETLREAQASEARLTRDERAAIQVALQWFGYYNLGIDAAFGPGTRRAMSAWQEDRGLDATGVLTTRQREALIRAYSMELAALGMEEWEDERAGIRIQLPKAMVQFDRYEAPFAHFAERDDSGVRALLISQSGTQATLFGLYEIMQTLDIVPLEGDRQRQANSFVLTGQSDTVRSHTFAQYQRGQIKGWTLIWTPARDEQMERVLPMMQESFATFGDTLPDGIGEASAVQRRDLLSGLTVRRPERSRSGFYIDATGTVLTSSEAVDQCQRVTIDEAYNASVIARDDTLGIAALRPETPLVPLAFAQFANAAPRPASQIWVSGFGFEDVLTRPLLTAGSLEDVRGLQGEDTRLRIGARVMPGDSGGPVFNGNGAVIGLLLPPGDTGDRLLPPEVNFAASADAVRAFLSENDIRVGTQSETVSVSPELLTRTAGDLTVLVSCWN